MIIEIVYIATNGYCNFAGSFIKSLQNFMPGVKKILRILSNGCEEYKLYRDDDILYTEIIPMFDIYYPCINLNKMYFISQLKPSIGDYIFYFDADTLCKNVPNYNWDKMIKDLNDDKILLTLHPIYTVPENTIWTVSENYQRTLPEQMEYMHSIMTEKNTESAAYIEQNDYPYVITSFFAGKRDAMINFCNVISEMIRNDLKREKGYHIPQYMDENYVNKIALEKPEMFIIKQYNEYGNFTSTPNPDVFIQQKNMNEGNKTNRQ